MTTLSGTRLGPYDVGASIGSGGMGEVYRARDTRLERTVAIKVLTVGLARDPEFRARFAGEARALAQIAHPNICVLYDVGEIGDSMYLVLEHLEGETLAGRIARGPLTLDELVRLGTETCHALETAHRAGIVHRDLKPANVMLTRSGAKLLDFGLAKDIGRAESASLTTAAGLTREDTIMGTPAYMAPEQLQGRPADARSDMFALGAVLYEAATAVRAFPGDTPIVIASAILSGDVPCPSAVQPGLPAAFDLIVQGCLAKDPEARWQSAHDVGRQIDALRTTAESGHVNAVTRRATWWPWAITAAALVLASALVVRALAKPTGRIAPHSIAFNIALPPGTSLHESVEGRTIALSPDGSDLAWVGASAQGSQIWIRPLSSLESHPLAGTDGASALFWSPDGRSIAFFSSGRLARVDRDGGALVPICAVPRGIGHSGTWGADGQILFAAVQGDAIYRVSTSGGTPERVVVANRSAGERRVAWPWFLDDGRTAIYVSTLEGGDAWLMLWRPGRPAQRVVQMATEAESAGHGDLVFARNGALLAQHLDLTSGRLTGDPVSLAERVNVFVSSGWAAFSASRTGTIAYASGTDQARLAWTDMSGRELARIGVSADYQDDMSLAPDGRSVLASRLDHASGTYDIWSIDLERATETRVTTGAGTEVGPVIAPDERSMIYSMTTGGAPELYRRNLATGTDERLAPGDAFQQATAITRDGRTVLYEQRTDRGDWDVWSMSLQGAHTATPVIATPSSERDARLSADDRMISFVSDEAGQQNVYVAPFPRAMPRIRVSDRGGSHPHWTPDGRDLLYLAADGRVMSVAVTTEPAVQVGTPVPRFAAPPRDRWLDFIPMKDGKRILALIREVRGWEQPLTVVTNAIGK